MLFRIAVEFCRSLFGCESMVFLAERRYTHLDSWFRVLGFEYLHTFSHACMPFHCSIQSAGQYTRSSLQHHLPVLMTHLCISINTESTLTPIHSYSIVKESIPPCCRSRPKHSNHRTRCFWNTAATVRLSVFGVPIPFPFHLDIDWLIQHMRYRVGWMKRLFCSCSCWMDGGSRSLRVVHPIFLPVHRPFHSFPSRSFYRSVLHRSIYPISLFLLIHVDVDGQDKSSQGPDFESRLEAESKFKSENQERNRKRNVKRRRDRIHIKEDYEFRASFGSKHEDQDRVQSLRVEIYDPM